jgi:hypothetical protein
MGGQKRLSGTTEKAQTYRIQNGPAELAVFSKRLDGPF